MMQHKLMQRLRIGNDITIHATVTRQGKAEDFTDKTLKVFLHSPYECVEVPFTVSDNVLTITWLGTAQKKLGTYTLTLVEDYDEGSRNTTDVCNIFKLVSRTCKEFVIGGRVIECRLQITPVALKTDGGGTAGGTSCGCEPLTSDEVTGVVM